jgi:hypothetical protein
MAGTLTISTLSDGTNSTSATNCIQGSAKAWVNFNGTGTVAIRASYNVSSITDNGTGDYTVNFTNAMPDANYAFAVGQQYTTSTSASDIGPLQAQGATAQTASSLRVALKSGSGLYDALIACVTIFD